MSEDEIKKSAIALRLKMAAMESELKSSVESLQATLADLLISDIVAKLKLENSTLKPTGNNGVLSSIDRIWSNAFERFIVPVLRKLQTSYTELIQDAVSYFERLGLATPSGSKFEALNGLLRARIGIDASGNLKRDGYLFRLGKSDRVREELKAFVQGAINRGASLVDFQKGFRGIITGSGTEIEGSLLRYYRQYAFDTFNQISEWANLQVAKQNGLEFFIYEGSLIDTSRRFCEKRAGKVFHVSETKDWVNDPDLVDKKTRVSYDPILDRGRYNCRHIIRWITYELAFRLRPDVVRFKLAA